MEKPTLFTSEKFGDMPAFPTEPRLPGMLCAERLGCSASVIAPQKDIRLFEHAQYGALRVVVDGNAMFPPDDCAFMLGLDCRDVTGYSKLYSVPDPARPGERVNTYFAGVEEIAMLMDEAEGHGMVSDEFWSWIFEDIIPSVEPQGPVAWLGIRNDGEKAVVSSRAVARVFGKDHSLVVLSIRKLIKASPDWTASRFRESFYSNDTQSVEYFMDRDGFSLLAGDFMAENTVELVTMYLDALKAA
ncbi:MAG: Rha family transcriptional regulator [Clostridiales bacterium]|nr:Rha family transcriptional regulator [Clostridiales bacterium]